MEHLSAIAHPNLSIAATDNAFKRTFVGRNFYMWYLRFLNLMLAVLIAGFLFRHRLAEAQAPDKGTPSLSVYPVRLSPGPFPEDFSRRVGMVIVTMLEKAGVQDVRLAESKWDPPPSEKISALAEAFGQHVAASKLGSDRAIFVQILGTPEVGVQGIQTIMVDRHGKVLLADSAEEKELQASPARPKDPMSCCVFAVDRIKPSLRIRADKASLPQTTKSDEFWRKDAGIPVAEEFTQMAARQAKLRRNRATATWIVFPFLVHGQSNRDVTRQAMKSLQDGRLGPITMSDSDPQIQTIRHSNEQKVLWNTALAFRDYVRQQKPDADYTLLVEYGSATPDTFFVHWIVCNRSGAWVIVDMQNSHQADYQRIHPADIVGLNKLLNVRWRSELGL